jgi:glycosyltransferase involved in cell wall biosynthesis
LDFVFMANPVSVHTIRWVDGLRARGHHVAVVPNGEPDAHGPAKLVGWLRHVLEVRRLARRRGAVLVVHWIPAGVRALVLLGIHPRIGVAWGSDIYLTTRETRRRALRAGEQAMFLRGCDAVAAPSENLVQAVIAAGARADRTTCVRFGVDMARFCPGPDPAELRSRLGLDGCRVVLSNRLIAPIYNQGTVVEALARLEPDVVAVMTRYLARPDEVARIERLAEEIGVSDRLRIFPMIPDEDMANLYRLADVVVSIPKSDGGPATVAEALACGRQVVACDLPSVRELLGAVDPDGLVPAGDVDATARAIERALDRPAGARAELSRRARAAMEELVDRDRAMAQMEELARRVSSSRDESGSAV